MSINNITRTNTVDEWRIQTNASATEINKLETGNYNKTAGTLSVTGAANVLIDATGTSLQVTNTALFSTDVIVGKSISLGAQETATGNLGIGGVVSIYGPATGLYVANTVVSNGSVIVKNSIVAANATINANVVVVGTANLGYLGVANTGVFGKAVTVGTTLDVTGNTTVGNLTTSNVVQTNIIRVDTYGTFGTNVTVAGNVTSGNLNSVSTITGDNIRIATSAFVGTTLDVTGNTTSGNLTTANATQTGTLRVSDTATVTGNLTAGNVNTSGMVYAGTLRTTGRTDLGLTLDVTGNTTSGNLTTANATQTGTLRVSDIATVTGNLTAGNVNTSGMVYAGTLRTTGRADLGSTLNVTSNTTTGNLVTSGRVYTDTLNAVTRADLGATYVTSLDTGTGDATVGGKLTVTGDFVLTGDIVYDTDVLSISSVTPVSTSGAGYFGVFRGNTTGGIGGANVNSLGTVSDANAYIRWSASANNWQIRDIFNSDNTTSYSKVLTANLITTSTSTTSNDTFASSWLTKNYVDNANTNLKSYVDVSAIAASQANVGAARIADTNSAQANVGAGLIIVRSRADGAYGLANLASNTFNGTSGQVTPSNGVISYTSTNGVTIAGSGNTFTVNTPQDLRSTASPTFAALTLTAPLAIAQGGTGATSAASALTGLLPTGTTSGYVLTTGGPGSFYWAAAGAGGSGTQPGTRIATNRLSYTGNGAGYHYATPTFSDTTQLRVYIDGVRQMDSEYSANVSNSRVMFTEAPRTGSPVLIEIDGYTTYAYYANNITYGPVTGSIPSSANTIQLAIDDLESRKAALAGATFTGLVTGTTQNANTSNTAMATTAYVQAALNLAGNTFNHSISGNAGTVTNGLYNTGTYADPTWLSSLSGNKITAATTSVKGVVQLADSTSNSSTTAAATANSVKTAVEAGQANVGGAVITLTGNYQANTGAALISAKSYTDTAATTSQANVGAGLITTKANYEANVGAGLIAVTGAYQANVGAGLISAKTTSEANVGAARISAISTASNADNLSSGTVASARLGTTGTPEFSSLGVGTAATGTAGEIVATGDITAGYSDDRLKTKLGNIENALDKVSALSGFYFVPNDTAKELGYGDKQQVGVSAQQVQQVLPEVVVLAPIGQDYLTVHYEKLVPLLIEAIKELKSEVEELKGQIK